MNHVILREAHSSTALLGKGRVEGRLLHDIINCTSASQAGHESDEKMKVCLQIGLSEPGLKFEAPRTRLSLRFAAGALCEERQRSISVLCST